MKYNLNEQEARIIDNYRAGITKEKSAETFRLAVIKVYYAWTVWSVKNGAELTYSTFCDDFNFNDVIRGIEHSLIDRRKAIYDIIHDIDEYLRKFVNSYFGINQFGM